MNNQNQSITLAFNTLRHYSLFTIHKELLIIHF